MRERHLMFYYKQNLHLDNQHVSISHLLLCNRGILMLHDPKSRTIDTDFLFLCFPLLESNARFVVFAMILYDMIASLPATKVLK